MNGIDKAIEIVGGQTALARAIGVTQGAVWQWKAAGAVPHEKVLSVYAACSGAVSPHELNPRSYPDPDYLPSVALVATITQPKAA